MILQQVLLYGYVCPAEGRIWIRLGCRNAARTCRSLVVTQFSGQFEVFSTDQKIREIKERQ